MANKSPREYVDLMLEKDHFSRWLGIEVIDVKKGYSKLKMTIKKDMLNGFGIVHGGIVFSFADSAFAFASNGYGRISVALDVSISFTKATREGDVLFAEAVEQDLGYKTGLYMVEIRNIDQELVALFKGNVYRTSKVLGETENQ